MNKWNAKGLLVAAMIASPGCVIVMVDDIPGICGDDCTDDDDDGLNNSDERQCGTNPDADDTDDNGVLDAEEDTDGDGYDNLEEIESGSACADATSTPDSELDEDEYEAQ